MFDADLQQADAQVVAWDANDEPLKEFFRAKASDPTLDLHTQNAQDIYNFTRKPTYKERWTAKQGVHATDYVCSAREMARRLDMTVHQADTFQKRWFSIHPAIRVWHREIESQLMTTRSVSNKFGYRVLYFGRVERLLPEALAWIPQSTVVRIIDIGLERLEFELDEVDVLLQVHDSVIGQFKTDLYPTVREKIHERMLVTVPYDDPLVIGVDIACSRKSWGDCEKVPWKDNHLFCPH